MRQESGVVSTDAGMQIEWSDEHSKTQTRRASKVENGPRIENWKVSRNDRNSGRRLCELTEEYKSIEEGDKLKMNFRHEAQFWNAIRRPRTNDPCNL
jgi:hypothetical protein